MGRPALEVIEGGKSAGRAWLKSLYVKYGSAVHARCTYLLKDPTRAEDAMQDVFARALDAGSSFRGQAAPLTWLISIATNHCLNLLRGEQARWHQQYAALEHARGEAHGGPQLVEARDLVRRALGRFDTETQAAVVHYWVDEMTLQEVADLLERSVPTVRKRLATFAEETGLRFADALEEPAP